MMAATLGELHPPYPYITVTNRYTYEQVTVLKTEVNDLILSWEQEQRVRERGTLPRPPDVSYAAS